MGERFRNFIIMNPGHASSIFNDFVCSFIGGTPYPGVSARELLRKLRSGWRMLKPAHVDMSL